MRYNKGQIVPRFLVRCKSRKTQHLWKFGCDVKVVNKVVTVLSDGCCFTRGVKDYARGGKCKPKIYDQAFFTDVTINGFDKAVEVSTRRLIL